MTYQPIENYGVIGDLHTVALVGRNGSIDWFCYPRFDSPSVFGAILDEKKGGCFRIAPICSVNANRQMYWPETNVLVTRFLSPDGVCEVVDFMPVGSKRGKHGRIVRRLRAVRGQLPVEIVCHPAFDYARGNHQAEFSESGVAFHGPDVSLALSTKVSMERHDRGARAEITLQPGETATFILHGLDSGDPCPLPMEEEAAGEAFWDTVGYWRRWVSQTDYAGRWRETVHRSALVLKLLTYEPTGAIVAAPTCSLPESIGEARNWDYRYTWIRDAAFTLYAFLRLGFTSEAAAFMEWIETRADEFEADGSSLHVMYGIDGHHRLQEQTLDHLEGYRGSRPVRIGNAAYGQLQLDIYGALMDAVYLHNKYGSPISHGLWIHLSKVVDWLVDNWRQKDEGVWEVRGARRHFVYSKLMCWVALDRALRLADKRSFPADRQSWLAARDAIYREIMTKGWNEDRQAFVLHYESEALDGANLIMPLVFFLSPTDARMLKTLDAVLQRPEEGGLVSDSLVYRYTSDETLDGLSGSEGTFNMVTFWLVEALTRAGHLYHDRLESARLIFEQMLGYANHLGLFAEETGPSGEALGNFPQAFTHLSLISAAFNLDQTLGKRGV